jgi:hypothetical protein
VAAPVGAPGSLLQQHVVHRGRRIVPAQQNANPFETPLSTRSCRGFVPFKSLASTRSSRK